MTPTKILIAMVLSFAFSLTAQAAESATPPLAAKKPKVMTKFGDRRVDDYFWLREKAEPEVIDYLKAENAYTQEVMKPLEGFRDKLYKELLARIKETDDSVPYRKRGYWYFKRELEGKQYPIYVRRKGSMDGPEEVLLDVNELAKDRKYTAVGAMDVSPDGAKLAYTVDFTGFRQYQLQVKDLATGKPLTDSAERVTSLAWAADNATLFWVEEDETTKRSYRLNRRSLGHAQAEVVYEEKDEAFDIGVGDTRSEAFLTLTSVSKDTSEVRVLRSNEPRGAFRVVEPRRKGHEYYLDHHEGEFYIRTNDKGRNFRVVRAPLADPARAHWREVVAHRPMVMLEEIDLFKDFWVLVERDKGLLKLRITDFASGKSHYIDFDEAVYTAHPGVNAEYATPTLQFTYESLVTPLSWYEYDVASRSRKLLKQQPVLGGYDPANYASEALTAVAKDGTRVPVSIVYRKSLRGDAPQPLLLYGYGSYGHPMDPNFRSSRVSLLDRGMIFAIAHIRGGGDRGKTWYDDGKLQKKKHTFEDFIAVADSLVRRKYTAPDKLVIQGGSAGGLLMGAVVNMRPDLFKAVVTQVPFVDV
ncbi:MAG TPA: S9 family peptidase, partial [Usitatibacter sp.]|nr:S9 family peptidase [Usitatibacter sp.]